MTELKEKYISVRGADFICYGGSQSLSQDRQIKKCGCGIVAAADLILYLRQRESAPFPPLSLDKYNKFLIYLNRNYFPLLPGLGMNALALTTGLNLYFIKRKMPWRASWLLSGEKLFERLEQQLREDIPVIMSVGPNFPFIWGKNMLQLYKMSPEGYRPSGSVKSHFITATACDEGFIRISSWGKELYIKKDEFTRYAREQSSSFLCNMLKITRK